jgi:ribonuclease P protein component
MKGPSLNGTYFRVTVSNSISDEKFNAAVVISKKYAKKSVIRNFIRRSIFRIISENSHILPKKTLIFSMIKQISFGNSVLERQKAQTDLEKDINSIIDQISKKYAKNS